MLCKDDYQTPEMEVFIFQEGTVVTYSLNTPGSDSSWTPDLEGGEDDDFS